VVPCKQPGDCSAQPAQDRAGPRTIAGVTDHWKSGREGAWTHPIISAKQENRAAGYHAGTGHHQPSRTGVSRRGEQPLQECFVHRHQAVNGPDWNSISGSSLPLKARTSVHGARSPKQLQQGHPRRSSSESRPRGAFRRLHTVPAQADTPVCIPRLALHTHTPPQQGCSKQNNKIHSTNKQLLGSQKGTTNNRQPPRRPTRPRAAPQTQPQTRLR